MPKRKSSAISAPPAPRGAMGAYIFFTEKQRPNEKKAQPDLSFGSMGRLLGFKWKELTDDEKTAFQKLAEKDKIRYEIEYKKWSEAYPEAAEEAKKRKKKKGKAEKKQKKKRAPNAYVLFSKANRPAIKEANPEKTFGQLGALVGKAWNALDADQKSVWEKKSKEVKAAMGL
jgi:hypothetical protein